MSFGRLRVIVLLRHFGHTCSVVMADSSPGPRLWGSLPRPIVLQDPQQVVVRVGEGRQTGAILDLLGGFVETGPGEEPGVAGDDDLVGRGVPVRRALARIWAVGDMDRPQAELGGEPLHDGKEVD